MNHRILLLFFMSTLFLDIAAKKPFTSKQELELQPMSILDHTTFNEEDHPYQQMHPEDTFPTMSRSTILYSRSPAPGYGFYILIKACFGCTEPDEAPLPGDNDSL